jgi:ribonuclease HI
MGPWSYGGASSPYQTSSARPPTIQKLAAQPSGLNGLVPIERTVVYTDGACIGNPGPGGWAWAVPAGAFASGAASRTTNQRMEICAALEAVRAHSGPLEVVSDSTYVVNCFRDRWWEGWLARGWLNKAKQPVANRDLWEPLIELVRAQPGRVAFRWVKGHGADPMNDLVDRLAVEAARTQTGRSGSGAPADLGPPDETGGADRRERASEAPAGHLLVVVGRPGMLDERGDQERHLHHQTTHCGPLPPCCAETKLKGYGPHPTADGVRRRLTEILEAKRQLHPDLVVLTGLNLGTEQLAAEAALAAGVPFVAALAYPDPDARWPAQARQGHRQLIEAARDVVMLQRRPPSDRAQVAAALRRRDAWLARHASEAVVVWDGEDELVGRSVRALRDALGEEEVWVLNPAG